MTIDKKLYGSFGAALAVTLLMGYVALSNIGKLGEGIEGLANKSSKCLYLAGDVENLTSDMLAQLRGVMVRGFMHDPEAMQKYYQKALADLDNIQKASTEFSTTTRSPELAQKMKTTVGDKVDTIRQAVSTIYTFASKGDMAEAQDAYAKNANPQTMLLSAAGNEITQDQLKLTSKKAGESLGLIPPARTIMLAMIGLSIVLGLVVIWMVRGISSTLQGSVAELSDGADQTANAASQISGSSQSLAQGASEQAASLEETSASAEEINSMARKNTDNSRATADLLSQSQMKVNQANHLLEDMVTSMNQINESSGKISKIIKVIDEIAFQTNILALNAAVEAARAGEAGMGFAVVADEVRSLAQRSAQAAKDTAVLIEDSIAKSNEGKLKVDQVALAIQAVTEDSVKVKVMVDEVSLGSQEQSKGIDQIGRAIAQMEQVTQTTAANAEQSAAAAEELNAQSEALKDVVGRLREMVGAGAGSGTGSTRRVTPPRAAPAKRKPQPRPAGFPSTGPARSKSANGGGAYKKKTVEEEFPMEESFQSF